MNGKYIKGYKLTLPGEGQTWTDSDGEKYESGETITIDTALTLTAVAEAGFIFNTTLDEISNKTISVTINYVTKTKKISELLSTQMTGGGSANLILALLRVQKQLSLLMQ